MPDPDVTPKKYGIRTHRPVRRRSSFGGCDLCGVPIDEAEVHVGAVAEVDHTEGSIAKHANDYFDRNDDGTLHSRIDDAINVEPIDRRALPPKR